MQLNSLFIEVNLKKNGISTFSEVERKNCVWVHKGRISVNIFKQCRQFYNFIVPNNVGKVKRTLFRETNESH